MSIATMKSRESSASASRRPSGVERTGLPAIVTIARIRPSPGVSISSRRAETGSSPANSGRSRTRLRHTSWWPGETMRRPTVSMAGSGNITPPSRSRLPVRTLSRVTAHWQIEPKPWVETPSRP